jgi:hypothetical protein
MLGSVPAYKFEPAAKYWSSSHVGVDKATGTTPFSYIRISVIGFLDLHHTPLFCPSTNVSPMTKKLPMARKHTFMKYVFLSLI